MVPNGTVSLGFLSLTTTTYGHRANFWPIREDLPDTLHISIATRVGVEQNGMVRYSICTKVVKLKGHICTAYTLSKTIARPRAKVRLTHEQIYSSPRISSCQPTLLSLIFCSTNHSTQFPIAPRQYFYNLFVSLRPPFSDSINALQCQLFGGNCFRYKCVQLRPLFLNNFV